MSPIGNKVTLIMWYIIVMPKIKGDLYIMKLKNVATTLAISLGFLTFGADKAKAGAHTWELRPLDLVEREIEPETEEYEVKEGDTLGVIAKAFNTDVHKLAKGNGISNIDLIFPGMTITKNIASDGEVDYTITEEVKEEQVEEAPQDVQEPVDDVYEEVEQEPSNGAVTDVSYHSSAPVLTQAEQDAKDIISFKESTHNYNATNGQYYGRYQLHWSYYEGEDWTDPSVQERRAHEYVMNRYGSWSEAAYFHSKNNWY